MKNNNCCEKPRKFLSISTRWGRRPICNNCGKPWEEESPTPTAPQEKKCEKCYGTGRYGANGEQTCPDCDGTEHNYCHDKSCHCHATPAEKKDYSHSHCWAQGKEPACGIPLSKHTQCCLCPVATPNDVRVERPLDRLYALYLEGRKQGTKQGYIDYFKVSTLLLNEIDRAKQQILQEVEEKFVDAIGKHNARILNEFQLQGKPDMPIIAYDERVCLVPAIELATKETLNTITSIKNK